VAIAGDRGGRRAAAAGQHGGRRAATAGDRVSKAWCAMGGESTYVSGSAVAD
jgi:hypothetical protein